LIPCVWGNDLKEVHFELKHKTGVIARAGYDDLLEKNQEKTILLCLAWIGGLNQPTVSPAVAPGLWPCVCSSP